MASCLPPAASLGSLPLLGKRIGIISETMGEGVSRDVTDAVTFAAGQLQALGAIVEEVSSSCVLSEILTEVLRDRLRIDGKNLRAGSPPTHHNQLHVEGVQVL